MPAPARPKPLPAAPGLPPPEIALAAAAPAPPPAPVLAAPVAPAPLPPVQAAPVPLASRRLGESGTVLLRVVVDVSGLPRQISLHRSSGYARLDEQALAAMLSARFQPLAECANACECLVIAPLQYDID